MAMRGTHSFQELIVWQKAHAFVLYVYKITRRFPNAERFGLCSQFQRAAVSIPANIAEGYKRLSSAEKLRFMNIAQGSLEECRYYIVLSKDLLCYIPEDIAEQLSRNIEEVSRLLNAYAHGIASHTHPQEKVLA